MRPVPSVKPHSSTRVFESPPTKVVSVVTGLGHLTLVLDAISGSEHRKFVASGFFSIGVKLEELVIKSWYVVSHVT
jgi:hypothetical protein